VTERKRQTEANFRCNNFRLCIHCFGATDVEYCCTDSSNAGRRFFFRQMRPGKGGQAFYIVKFCTMTNDCDTCGFLLPDAQRLTRIGTFLRCTSLDELPELWNVLKGDMSIVGPRPLLMQYLDRYAPEQARGMRCGRGSRAGRYHTMIQTASLMIIEGWAEKILPN